MSPTTQPFRRSYRVLAILALLGLIPVVGLTTALSAGGHNELPRTMINACLAMMGVAWQAAESHLSDAPLATTAVLFLAGSLLWAVFRTVMSLVNTCRLLQWTEAHDPGRDSKLHMVMTHPDLRNLRVRLLDSTQPLAFTLGLWRPQVILSSEIVSGLSEEELRAVLFHELGHVRNRDPLRLAVVRFLADALWFLPVARSLARDFVDTVEEGADDWAVKATRQPVDLASALVKTARARVAWAIPGTSFFAGNLSVEDRVERLLGLKIERRTGANVRSWVASGLITLFLFVPVMWPLDGREAAVERAMEEAMMRMPMMSCSRAVRSGR